MRPGTGDVQTDVGDNTDLLPRVVAARRVTHVVLGAIAAGLFALVLVLTLAHPGGARTVAPGAASAVADEAHRLGMILDASTQAAHVLADNIASGQQIRAAILTDVATVKDLVESEIQLPRNLNQTLELMQLENAKRTVLLVMPAGSPEIIPTIERETRIEPDGHNELAIVVGAPITPYDATPGITGELALSTPIDFTVTRDNLTTHAVSATLRGPKWSYSLLAPKPTADAVADPIRVPVTVDAKWKIAPLTLEVAPALVTAPAAWLNPVRLAAAGLGLAMLLVLALSLYRNRDP